MNKIREKEQRKYDRLKAYHLAKYKLLSTKEPRPGYDTAAIKDIGAGKDIGGGGICLLVKDFIPVSSIIDIKINFPKLDNPISAVARVVWIKHLKRHNLYELGAQFTEIDESARKAIDEQVKFVIDKINKGIEEKKKISIFKRLFFQDQK
jgi:c-di-GMP-binding flagellar brake protein YcgR